MPDVNQMRANAPGFDPRLFLRDEELDYGIALVLAGERALLKGAADIAGDYTDSAEVIADTTARYRRILPGSSAITFVARRAPM